MAEEQVDEWIVRANAIMNVTLITKGEKGVPKAVATFKPTWTYPIVGEQETIYGYKDLRINLWYNSSDMRPRFSYTHSGRIPNSEAIQDIHEVVDLFKPFLPIVAFSRKVDFEIAVQNTPDDWHPPGKLIETYEGDTEGSYEVWKGSLADHLVLALVNRVQILVSLLIEAGTPIATEPTKERAPDPLDRWTAYFLYQKRPRSEQPGKYTYVFAGYSTVYRFFIFRTSKSTTEASRCLELSKATKPFSEFPCRSRISQFIILEPFQRKGNGQRLYKSVYRSLLEHPATFEITVEDPNEAFDVLRDTADLAFLRQQPDFNAIQINTSVRLPEDGPVPSNIVDRQSLESIRTKYKIASRQFSRLVEMHLMSKLPDSVRTTMESATADIHKGKKIATAEDEHHYRQWKLITKSRIAKQNKEQLAAFDHGERIEKLDEALRSVELEYALLLSIFEQRQGTLNNKRKLDDAGAKEPGSGKKARVGSAASMN